MLTLWVPAAPPSATSTIWPFPTPVHTQLIHTYQVTQRACNNTITHSMDLSDFSKRIYELTITINEESSQSVLYNCLMQISQLSQTNIIIPIPAQNYIIDNKNNPSIIACIATSSKRVTFSGHSYSGSIFFNSDHSENITSRIPTDLATTKNSATLLTCLVALRLIQRLGIKRLLILTRSKLLTNILNRRNYNVTHDTSDISQKLKG